MAQESQRFSLSRWSRRKHAARREVPAPAAEAPPVAPAPAASVASPAPIEAVAAPAAAPPVEPLPPVDTLSLASDFTPFMKPEVEASVQRAALRKLFSDPHFNVMDGLDVYIDDYNTPDPMPAGVLDRIAGVYERLTQERVAEETAASAEDAAAAADGGLPPAPTPAAPGGSPAPDAPHTATPAAAGEPVAGLPPSVDIALRPAAGDVAAPASPTAPDLPAAPPARTA